MASSVLRFRFRFLGLPRSLPPGFPCVRPRFRYSASLYVSFRPSLIRSHSCSSGAYFRLSPSVFSASLPLPFVRFFSASGYLACLYSFPFFPLPPYSWLSRCLGSALAFAPSVFPVLSRLVSRAFLPGSGTQLCCLFLFALPRFAPTAVPRVLAFFSAFASFPAFSVLLPLSFVRFCFPSGYSALCFFLSVHPVSASQWLNRCCLSAFASLLSPFLPGWFPIRSLPVLRTRLPVRFLSSFPVSLPQPLTPVLPFFSASSRPLLFRAFRLLSGFFRPLQPASDYSACCSFFSLLPVFPWQGFSRCATVSFVPVAFLFCPACFHAVLPIPVLSFLRFPFSALLFRVTGTTQLPASCFQLGRFPWLSL